MNEIRGVEVEWTLDMISGELTQIAEGEPTFFRKLRDQNGELMPIYPPLAKLLIARGMEPIQHDSRRPVSDC